MTPLAFTLAVYPDVPLGLVGREYVGAAPMLVTLALTIPATLIGVGVNSLLYAYGMYASILALGLIGNLSRIAMYVPPS